MTTFRSNIGKDRRWLEQYGQQQYVTNAGCTITNTNPVEIACDTNIGVATDYDDDDDGMSWFYATRFHIGSYCQFTSDLSTMRCSTSVDHFQESSAQWIVAVQSICSIEALQAGYATAEACYCGAMNTRYPDMKCWKKKKCGQGETEKCFADCLLEETCQCSFLESYDSDNNNIIAEYNGIPWTDNFMDLLQDALQSGAGGFDLKYYIDSSQPSIQYQSSNITWNMESSQCQAVPRSHHKARINSVSLFFLVAIVGVVFAFVAGRRR